LSTTNATKILESVLSRYKVRVKVFFRYWRNHYIRVKSFFYWHL